MSLRSRSVSPRLAGSTTRRLQVEALEDRSVPAVIADPVGDFLPTYTGVQAPGLDVVAHEVVLIEEQGRIVFYGKMAGSIAETQAVAGVYLIGVDRGQGTPRFLNPGNSPPEIGPNVVWDAIVRVSPNGTGGFLNSLTGAGTPLDPASITINGDEFTVSVPLSLLVTTDSRPPAEWTYNLWPRNGLGKNVQVSDLAPDDGNSPVHIVAPARVAGVVVNDGSAQRSMVNSLTVTFDGPVTLDPGAFQLTRQDGIAVDLNVAISIVNGQTVAVLTFAGAGIVGGSLVDGNYALTICGDLVHDAYGRALDGDADGTAGGNRSDSLFRLYGDSDGDRDVDLRDLGRFLSSFGRRRGDTHYLAYFDVNGDDQVGVVDLIAFARRLGTHMNP
jgi:hypothetical protein